MVVDKYQFRRIGTATRRENENVYLSCLFSLKGLTVFELPCREYLQFPCGGEQEQTGR